MNDPRILARARAFYSTISKRYASERYYERLPLNTFWRQQNMPLMEEIIRGSADANELVQRAQRTLMFSVNVQEPVKERAIDWLLAEQRSRGIDLFSLRSEVQESEYSFAGNNVERRGRRLTPDFLRTVNIGLRAAEFLDLDRRKIDVVELGGGLGHLARTLRLLGYTRSHVIVDLPETLVFSYCFLSLNFPQARLRLVEDEASARALAAGDYDFAFVPALLADAVACRPYDLFVNIASMGEMRNEVIRDWMRWIQERLQVRSLYTLNRYLNTIDPRCHQWRWEENECSVHYDPRWQIQQWELEPGFTRCPYVDTIIARYVEIAAVRLPSIEDADRVQAAADLLQKVRDQDWCQTTGDSARMTRGEHVLAHDLGLNGTLFPLWDAVRLRPTAEAVAILLRYIETLLRRDDLVFEEERYYEDLLFRLYDPERDGALREFVAARRKKRLLQSNLRQLRFLEARDGYNLIQAGEAVIAVATSLGDLRLLEERLGERDLPPLLFITRSLEEARHKIAGLQNHGAGVVEVHRGFNIVCHGEGFYGVHQGIGYFDLARAGGAAAERSHAGRVVFGESVEVVRGKIDALLSMAQAV